MNGTNLLIGTYISREVSIDFTLGKQGIAFARADSILLGILNYTESAEIRCLPCITEE